MTDDDDRESISSIAAEVIADFPEQFSIYEICLAVNNRRPEMLQFWAYERATPTLGRRSIRHGTWRKSTKSSAQLARAVGILFRLILEGIVIYLTERGAQMAARVGKLAQAA